MIHQELVATNVVQFWFIVLGIPVTFIGVAGISSILFGRTEKATALSSLSCASGIAKVVSLLSNSAYAE